MNIEEFKTILIEGIKKNNIEEIDENSISKLYEYMKNVLEWNEKINVTAIKNEKDFIYKHYIDSLLINEYIKENSKVIDIGTGGGFPGIPVKIVNDSISITLIDSVNKKLNVIRESIKNLHINNVEIIHTRAEDLYKKKEYFEQYDVATTRAVSNFKNIATYMLPFLKKGGIAICMKGPNYKEELEDAINEIKKYGGEVSEIKNYNINTEYERNIIIIKKVK